MDVKIKILLTKRIFSNSKLSQVTIFIILAILIVIGIIAFFVLRSGFLKEEYPKSNPQRFIEKCVADAVEPSVRAVMAGGGRIEPSFFKMYRGEKYNYLCYQKNYYLTCVNQYPQLKKIIEEEIKQDCEKRIEKCFNDLRIDLENKGFMISESDLNYSIELVPQKVLIKINKKMDISKGDKKQSFKKFNVAILSPLYELSNVAREIVNHESQYCNFEYNGFMLFYPQYDIKRISYDESRLYRIIDRRSGAEFKFAVRSCALPPGL